MGNLSIRFGRGVHRRIFVWIRRVLLHRRNGCAAQAGRLEFVGGIFFRSEELPLHREKVVGASCRGNAFCIDIIENHQNHEVGRSHQLLSYDWFPSCACIAEHLGCP